MGLVVQIVVIQDLAREVAEGILLPWKGPRDLGMEQFQAIAKSQLDPGKDDRRSDLGREGKIFPTKPQLSH